MSGPPSFPRPRPVPPEPLLPLLFRRISFAYYRRSERYRWYVAHSPIDDIHPVPALADALLLELLSRLPARAVRALGLRSLRGLARGLAFGVRCLEIIGKYLFLSARSVYRALRRLGRWARRTRSGPATAAPPFATPAERAHG